MEKVTKKLLTDPSLLTGDNWLIPHYLLETILRSINTHVTCVCHSLFYKTLTFIAWHFKWGVPYGIRRLSKLKFKGIQGQGHTRSNPASACRLSTIKDLLRLVIFLYTWCPKVCHSTLADWLRNVNVKGLYFISPLPHPLPDTHAVRMSCCCTPPLNLC